MSAWWGSFAVGLGLVLAPLVLGYGTVASILHDVAMGSLVCIASVAALERPGARLALAAPSLWLIFFAPASSERAATLAQLLAGALLLALAAVPSTRAVRRTLGRAPRSDRVRARA